MIGRIKSLLKHELLKLIIILIAASIIGTASATHYLGVSNTLEDEINVSPNKDRIPLQVEYADGRGLGGENKTLEEGDWEEFVVRVNNESPEPARAWENIFLWAKFYGVNNEQIKGSFKLNGEWENSRVYDLRTLEPGEVGGIVEFGSEDGWTVPSKTSRNFDLRVKFETPIENMKVKIKAVLENHTRVRNHENLKNPNSETVLEPTKSSYIHQGQPNNNYGEKPHLEVTTKENSNVYTLLEFDSSEVPETVKEGVLRIYQYWGSRYSELRSSKVSVQVFSVTENWSEKEVSWDNRPEFEKSPVAERQIHEMKEWYRFDISELLKEQGGRDKISLLIKLEEDNFDSKERRIRFKAPGTEKPPYIKLGEL